MELKEFLQLLKNNLKVFILILLVSIMIGFLIFDYQNKLYIASVGVDITRDSKVNNKKEDYQYDQFYRLQADEKFGQNIVSWLEDPNFIKLNRQAFEKSEVGSWENILAIKTSQPSASYVRINFKSKDPQSAILFGKVLKKGLNQKNQQLNFSQNENWFKLIIGDTYVSKNNPNFYLFLTISFLLGIFLGILGVLFKYYFNSTENENRN